LAIFNNSFEGCLFEDWMMFCGVLSQTPLETLELRNNGFDLQCATPWVAQILLHCRQLQTLALVGNHLDCNLSDSWDFLCQVLSQCQRLKVLLQDICFNGVSPDASAAFCGALSQCQELHTFGFSNNDFNKLLPEGWIVLCRSLSQCPKFCGLVFIDNNLHTFLPLDWMNVGQALSQFPQLKYLSLLREQSLQALSSDYWRALGDAVSQGPQLEFLNLSCNALHTLVPDNWVALFQGLSRCQKLQELNFERAFIRSDKSCGLSVDSCIALCIGLSQCTQLKVLDFSHNQLGKLIEVWLAFCDGLSQCKQLHMLDLSYNSLNNLLPHCWTALSQCKQLQALNLSDNQIGQRSLEDWQALCEALSQCRQLRTLSVRSYFSENYEAYQRIFLKAMPDFCGELRMDWEESENIFQAVIEENRRKTKDCMVGAVDVVRHILPVQELRPVVLSFLFPVWQKPLLQRIDQIMEAKEKRKAGLSIV
jgi:Leucine-rich repeat (LRR) protein